MTKEELEDVVCPVEVTLAVIGGKWKTLILYHLIDHTLRFSELKRTIPEITQRMLTNQLRELERDGVVHRKVFPEVPVRVEYSLTEDGYSLVPILEALCEWGCKKTGQNFDKIKAMCEIEKAERMSSAKKV